MNFAFAGLYMLGDEALRISIRKVLGAFFFSVETLATVGYGDMHPATVYGHWVSIIEILWGCRVWPW